MTHLVKSAVNACLPPPLTSMLHGPNTQLGAFKNSYVVGGGKIHSQRTSYLMDSAVIINWEIDGPYKDIEGQLLDAWLKFTLEVRPDASRPTYQLYILHSRAFVLSIGAEWELMPDPITPRAGLIYATRCNPSSTFASHFLLPLFLPLEMTRQQRAKANDRIGP